MSGGHGPGNERFRYSIFPAERDILAWLVSRAPTNVVVEIGARGGHVTHWFRVAAPHLTWHVVDPWDGTQDGAGEEMYREFYARVGSWPRIHRDRSRNVTPPDNLGLVFHDGDHRDLSDLGTWWRALVPGGLLVVHDYHEPGWPEVKRACDAMGSGAHSYRYHATPDDRAEYGPSPRGLWWQVKP